MRKIKSLLIANRGEIACRIIRTAKDLGVRTVAVYSDADKDALHVRLADDRRHIGPSPAAESYLDIDAIIGAAKAANADAIHPGYGFLSENAEFAKAVRDAGLIFVGPREKAIEIMGDKARSKRAMLKANVPCIPGYQGTDQSDETLLQASTETGFPLMVKAAAGGGGRGMRLVQDEGDLPSALKLARSEAENAFGSGDLIIERAIANARHVEIQVFADEHGNIVHLGERDCSIQRRHQKIIEEAPCPVLTPQLRAAMGAAAVEAARAVEYVGAGTVEFLLTADAEFFFLEMNTRLQVEHPVTEMITGLDLVALQLSVAEGEALPLSQADVSLNGHAIEVRLYAEDALNDFLPSTGLVQKFLTPVRDGVRADTGIETGAEVSSFYDPMVAKIIAHAPTREQARRKIIRALEETVLVGPKNNRDFLIHALSQEAFSSGEATTEFVNNVYGPAGFEAVGLSDREYAIAAAIQYSLRQRAALSAAPHIDPELLYWSSAGRLRSVLSYLDRNDEKVVSVISEGTSHLRCVIGKAEFEMTVSTLSDDCVDLLIDHQKLRVMYFEQNPQKISLYTPTNSFEVTDISGGRDQSSNLSGSGDVTAPMHGRLLELFFKEGDKVDRGDTLAILEAMKMQHEIVADVSGDITLIEAAAGTQIGAGELILKIDIGNAE